MRVVHDISFTPSPDLFPFESKWFEGSAGRMHYVDEGSGQAILMLHGNPTWSFLYREIIKSLRPDFRCVAVDYLGFGLSDRPAEFGYTAAEHAACVLDLVRKLDLRDVIVMGHDWGGPIGTSVAAEEPDRVAGLALGNTWFWPADRRTRTFSRVMSSPPLQDAVLRRNFFVNRLIPGATSRKLTDEEMHHYRAVQPTPASRAGVAELPRQLVDATPWLAELAVTVPRELGGKRTLITWPMRDIAFPAKKLLPRMRATFTDHVVVELPDAKHYLQEDAPQEVSRAVRERFG